MSFFGSAYFGPSYYGAAYFGGSSEIVVFTPELPALDLVRSLTVEEELTGRLAPRFVYPYRDLDRPAVLRSELGGYWSQVHTDELPGRYAYQRAQLETQTVENMQEAVASVSRLSTPVHHVDRWQLLTLKESELTSDDVVARYGEAFQYGGDPLLHYGEAAPRTLYSFPLPAGLKAAPWAFNRLSAPSTAWLEGVDYQLDFDLGLLQFRQNPFESGFAVRTLYTGDEATDREAAVWLFRAELDQGHIYAHHGYVLGLKLPSSVAYRNFLNALYDGMVEGGHYLAVTAAVSALADVPLVASDEETVRDIVLDSRALWVITDKQAYRFAATAEACVEIGDVVRRGDPLTDAVKIYEFHRGEVPAELRALTIGRSLLDAGYREGITFKNQTVALVAGSDGVFTRVSFELGGWPRDVDKFWDDVHARGLAAGGTLANLLDKRDSHTGDTPPSTLPATINPLEFLAANVLRNNAFVVVLKTTKFGPDALPMRCLRYLRRLIPPHTTLLVVAQLDVDDEPIRMDGPGDETRPGYEEEVSPYEACEPISEAVTPELVGEAVTLRYVDGVCL